MKVLVLSDSHAGLSFMRAAVKALRPDAVIHLGDYYDDGEVLAEENSHIPMYQVPGNCDRFRCFGKPEMLCLDVGGVRMFMTHGHNQGVKQTLGRLVSQAREYGAAIALYGHTHSADCHREPDGLWVVNPGSCGSFGGSVAMVETADGSIAGCSILRADDFTVSAEPQQ